jgi:hypothetical protein
MPLWAVKCGCQRCEEDDLGEKHAKPVVEALWSVGDCGNRCNLWERFEQVVEYCLIFGGVR